MEPNKLKRIRNGKTININWRILTNRATTPLADRDLRLLLISPSSQEIVLDYTVKDGTTLVATFQGTQNTTDGVYRIVLWENYGKDGQTVVDAEAFETVPTSDMEN